MFSCLSKCWIAYPFPYFSEWDAWHGYFTVYGKWRSAYMFACFWEWWFAFGFTHFSESDDLHMCFPIFLNKMKVLIMYFHISRKLQNYKCGFANFRNDECHMCCRVLLKVINSICFCGIFGAWRDAYVISHFQKVINCTCVFTFFWKRRITNLFSHFSEHHEMHICFRTSLESDESYICFRIFQNIIKCICVFAILRKLMNGIYVFAFSCGWQMA